MKNKSFSLSALLHNNKFVFIFSIVCSLVIWFVVTYSTNTMDTHIIHEVPVVINTDNNAALQSLGLDVVGGHTYTVSVEINSLFYQKHLIDASDIQTSVELGSVTAPGEYSLNVIATRAPGSPYDFTITKVIPETLALSFDRFKTVQMAVTPKEIGAAAPEGLRVDSPVLADAENQMLEVKGPESTVVRIASAVAEATVNKTLEKTETFTGDIVLYDEAGKVIDKQHLTLSFSQAQVTVPISKLKEVPVVAIFTNIPEAYRNTPIAHTLNIDKVTVSGPPDSIDAMTRLELEPIDFGRITPASYRFTQKINPPSGVKVTDSSTQVRVTISTKNLISKKLDVTNFEFRGLAAGKKAQVMSSLSGVTVAGMRGSVNALSSSNVYGELDLTDRTGSGEYEVIVAIKFRNHKDVWAVSPAEGQYTVFVKIS